MVIFDPLQKTYVYATDFKVMPCDIFFTRGYSLLSRLIRIGEKHPGDWNVVINHTGIVVEEGTISTACVIEARSRVLKHTLWSAYHTQPDLVSIYRPLGLTDEQRGIIVNKALDYKDRTYGYLKIFTNSLDFFSGGHYIFRRLTNDDNYPICSWVVSHAYSKVDLTFGCPPGQATPDDIWDYCKGHSNKYEKIFDLQKIS